MIPSLDALEQHRNDGRVLGGGLLVGARAVGFLVEAASHEEVTSLLRGLPFWGIIEWQVTPLESFERRAALERQQVEWLKQATTR